MKCPFLQEAEVQYCGHSLLRKLIVRKQENMQFEKCSTPAFASCAAYQQDGPEAALPPPCPHLTTSLAQYCSAASVTRFVPYSEELLSRCGRATFRYCDVYLSLAHPEVPVAPHVDGIPVPEWLLYAPNHMWLDESADGGCHIGIDGLLAKVLGQVERIGFLTPRGEQCPAAILTTGGVDLQILFPNPIRITSVNTYLRANPAKLTSDPYRLGWLFEGVPAGDNPASARAGLLAGGNAASQWMDGEVDRLSRMVHELVHGGDTAVMADGGSFVPGLLSHMDRAQALELYHSFFSPSHFPKRSQP